MIKKRHNSDGKLSRTGSQHGSKIESFSSPPPPPPPPPFLCSFMQGKEGVEVLTSVHMDMI